MTRNILRKILVCALLLSVLGCAGTNGKGGFDIGTLGSSILGSTGLVSGSQADALFKAGGKLAKSAEGLTEEQEYYLGRGVSATVFSKYRPVRNQQLLAYVNKVGNAVAAVSDRPETFGGYHVMVLDSSEINAVSAPGGFIFLTSGFLKVIPDEDALAAVLAHEVAHIALAHGVKAISESNLTDALLIVGKEAAASQGGAITSQLTSTFGDSITDVTNTLLTKGYGRSQEYDADKYAAALLKRAGYNSTALVSMLQVLQRESANKAAGGWFSTHPDPKKREREVADEVGKPGAPDSAQTVRAARFRQAVKTLG